MPTLTSNVRLVPATAELIERFYGKPQERSIRGIVMVRGDEVLGVGGYYVDGARVVVFSELNDEGMLQRKLIMRGAYEVLGMAAETGMPAHAIPDPRIPSAAHFLKQLGFTELGFGVWEWRT